MYIHVHAYEKTFTARPPTDMTFTISIAVYYESVNVVTGSLKWEVDGVPEFNFKKYKFDEVGAIVKPREGEEDNQCCWNIIIISGSYI